ncbi:MAG TPA: oxygen-independent coproporphyrinogen III oxidase [Planctomycetota bacterium]|nr:oxygen-independent coproporphyrinogen III oxidase [Planctomycetota bacterium]
MPLTTAQLVRRYDRPGPRYTSYPTALELHEGLGADAYRTALGEAAARSGPLSLYVHLPFCEERCLFCGCHVVVTRHREIAERYLGFLEKEIAAVAGLLGHGRKVTQLHWGGGTPTYLAPAQMRRLFGALRDRFAIDPDAEIAIEVDPRVTTAEHLQTLRDLGFNRLSAGVQDFATDVQEAIGRRQTYAQAAALAATARALGFRSLNLDLVYGLPRQTPESFGETLRTVTELRPDRLAIYSYAHVPWLKGHQRRIDVDELPQAETKAELLAAAVRTLSAAGYAPIGMDHFALPDDELARAALEGGLWRNFMGYTVRRGNDLVGLGLSAIGDLEGTFFQNHRKLHAYERAAEEGGLAAERGYAPTPDDRLRRHVITELMCNFRLDRADVERRFGIRFDETFAREILELRPLEQDGLVRVDAQGITVAERLLVRNVCMVFDAYLGRHGGRPRWSRTV